MILTLQYLRGIAALMVVLFHLGYQAKRLGFDGHFQDCLFAGVDLFFILSGFLMWAITAERTQTPVNFFMRRAARIIPLYWFLTTLVVLIMIFAPNMMVVGRFILTNVIGSYLFIGMPHSTGYLLPVITVGWTLNMEMMFYIIFASSLIIPSRARGLVVSGFLLILFLGRWVLPQNPWTEAYTSSILLEFIYGIAIGEFYRRGHLRNFPLKACAAFIAIGLAGIIVGGEAGPTLRGVLAGIPAALVFIGFLAMNGQARLRPVRWLKDLGDCSYSLYLTHNIVLSFAFQTWRVADISTLPGHLILFGIYGLALSIVVAKATFKFIETPLTNYFQRYVNSRFPEPRHSPA